MAQDPLVESSLAFELHDRRFAHEILRGYLTALFDDGREVPAGLIQRPIVRRPRAGSATLMTSIDDAGKSAQTRRGR